MGTGFCSLPCSMVLWSQEQVRCLGGDMEKMTQGDGRKWQKDHEGRYTKLSVEYL